MQSRVVLISNDSNFFEYILPKLVLRKNDELFRFSFDEIPDKVHLISSAVLVINAEECKAQTLELLDIVNTTSPLIFLYNDDEQFRISAYKKGALSFLTPLTSEEEFQAQMSSAFNTASVFGKNATYREIMVQKKLLSENNEVYLDYNFILDKELQKIAHDASSAVLVAISPDEKSKFFIKPNQLETIILNNIRKNDVLMSYAVNKYFLLLQDTDLKGAEKIWEKIQSYIPEKVYAGFAKTFSKSRQQLVNEVLNKLHEAINYEKISSAYINTESDNSNFKLFKQEYNKKIQQIVNPAFYHIRQKYADKFMGVIINQKETDGSMVLELKKRSTVATFKLSNAGFTRINLDITFDFSEEKKETKRISLESDELETGLLEDLLEQFMIEFKQEVCDGN